MFAMALADAADVLVVDRNDDGRGGEGNRLLLLRARARA